MNKLIRSRSAVLSLVQRSCIDNIRVAPCFSIPTKVYKFAFVFTYNLNIRKMSQKSITSFFKIKPKIVTEVQQERKSEVNSTSKSPLNNGTGADLSPLSNGKEKRSSKRLRLDSSSSTETSPLSPGTSKKSSPVSSKKKTKRQRIESSESEAELPQSQETEIDVKLEKAVKTYDSPKNKTSKVKVKKSSLPVKNEEEIVKTTKSPTSTKNTGINQETLKSPASIKKTKVKQEAVKDEKKKDSGSKEVSSVFVTEANGVSEKNEKEENGHERVPEEEYNPAKAKYHPIADACWGPGQEVPYLALAKTLEAIEVTSARLKMIEILSNYFRSVIALTPEDLLPSVYLCLNQLAPAYHSLELGIAETYLMKAVGQCTGRTLAQVRAAAHKAGDLGRVAESARASQRTMFAARPLVLRKVFAALKEIAHITGQASVNKKINKIQSLFIACRLSEARYLIRSLEGKLRIGLAEQSVLQALALATTVTPPGPGGVHTLDASKGVSPEVFKSRVEEQALVIKTTYCECPNYEALVPALLAHGARALPDHCRLTPGVPLKPMLAHPTRGLQDLFNRFENCEFTCEWKYDGERAQIHVPPLPLPAGEGVVEGERGPDFSRAAIFSRNQEDNSSKYPDVRRRLPALLGPAVTSCVLDAEAVAYDVPNQQILPFQILSTRKRKEAAEADIKVQVCVFVFDLLYLNGRALVREPLAERRRLLREHFHQVPGEWQFATGKDCSSMEEVQLLLEESVRGSCEGLMVKMLRGENARYDIARRSHNWLKLKKDYLEGVGDTLDVVPLGGYLGRGKRAGAFGGFLLACYDADADEYQSLCKIGTGFSDEDLHTLTAQLNHHRIHAPRNYYRYEGAHEPDAWFAAACVWEVRAADLSLSPAHRAARGLVHPDKGISLRFPRFVRVREDKAPEQATSARQVADMYLAQDQVRNQAAASASASAAHDDFY